MVRRFLTSTPRFALADRSFGAVADAGGHARRHPGAEDSGGFRRRPSGARLIDGLGANELSEAMKLLRQNYVDPNALGDPALARAQLDGLLARLGPGAKLVAAANGVDRRRKPAAPSPFHTEVLDGLVGYVRLGALTKENLAKLDAALKGFAAKKIGSMIFDLRATPASSDYDLAAQVINRFVPKGRPLFTLHKPGTKEQRLFTSNADPIYNGYVVIVVDYATAGASEVIAAVTRLYARSMVVGQATAGQAVEYADFALGPNYLLRIAVAEVMPPANVKIFPDGVKPDLAVEGAPTTAAGARSRVEGGAGTGRGDGGGERRGADAGQRGLAGGRD